MVTITGPIQRSCGHSTFASGFEAAVTPERARWYAVVPCEICRFQRDWQPTREQIAASRAAWLSEGKACP